MFYRLLADSVVFMLPPRRVAKGERARQGPLWIVLYALHMYFAKDTEDWERNMGSKIRGRHTTINSKVFDRYIIETPFRQLPEGTYVSSN